MIEEGKELDAYYEIIDYPGEIKSFYKDWIRMYRSKAATKMLFKSLETHCSYLARQGSAKVVKLISESPD